MKSDFIKSVSIYSCLVGIIAMLHVSTACITVNAPDTLLPTGGAFVLSGTTEVIDVDGPCLVWRGNNGVIYHLFQHVNLESELFDEVTVPGVSSRLEVAERSDLDVGCAIGPTVEVRDVLEVIE